MSVIGLEEYQRREKQIRADYEAARGQDGADRKALRAAAIARLERECGYSAGRAQAEVARWR